MKRKRSTGRRKGGRRRVKRGRMGRPQTSMMRGLPKGNRPELKTIDVGLAVAAHASTNALFNVGTGADGNPGFATLLLNPCIQGSDQYQRIGRQMVMKSLLLRLCVNHEPSADPTTTTTEFAEKALGAACMRIMVVYDSMTNHSATAPTQSQLLISKSGADGTPAAQADNTVIITSPTNLDARERYRIIYDKVWCYGGQIQHYMHWKKFRRLNLPVQYNAGANKTAADIEIGAIWLVTWFTGTRCPSASLASRIRFVDV